MRLLAFSFLCSLAMVGFHSYFLHEYGDRPSYGEEPRSVLVLAVMQRPSYTNASIYVGLFTTLESAEGLKLLPVFTRCGTHPL
jgi:hypothetical protein